MPPNRRYELKAADFAKRAKAETRIPKNPNQQCRINLSQEHLVNQFVQKLPPKGKPSLFHEKWNQEADLLIEVLKFEQ